MHLHAGYTTPFAGGIPGSGPVFGFSERATEFMLLHHLLIRRWTAYTGTPKVIKRP